MDTFGVESLDRGNEFRYTLYPLGVYKLFLGFVVDNLRIKTRINRIIGQLKGIERMVAEGRDCEEVLHQIAAVKRAIDGLTKVVLSSSICQFVPEEKQGEVEKVISRAVDL